MRSFGLTRGLPNIRTAWGCCKIHALLQLEVGYQLRLQLLQILGTKFPSLSIHLPSLGDVRFGPVVLSGRARFLAGIWRCVVGGGWANSSTMETVNLFLLRSVQGRARSVYVFEVSLRRILTPPITIRCSFRFLFLPGHSDVFAVTPPACALFRPPYT